MNCNSLSSPSDRWEDMTRRCNLSLRVAVAVTAIAYVYVSTVFVFIDKWFGIWSSNGIMNVLIFTAVALLCVYNYAVAIFTHPGRVPATYMPDTENADITIQELKRKDGELRYCQKCSLHKPPRAHHCRICKRCVLRMDHHCIWMNNCVGNANYKPFFLFVLYAVISCVYSLVLLIGSLMADAQKDEPQTEGYFTIIYIISGILLIPLTVSLSVLLGWHILMILQNKTTIEYHEGIRAKWLAEKGGGRYRHPYYMGVYKNIVSVLGPDILCWLCPTSSHVSSGLHFRAAYQEEL